MDKRTLLAVVLSIIVLLGWSIIFKPAPVPQKAGPPPQASPQARPDLSGAATPPPQDVPEELPMIEVAGGSDIHVETDLYKAVFSTQGAVLKSWELKEYLDTDKEPVKTVKGTGEGPVFRFNF